MKKLLMFHFEGCPYCRKAFQFLEELKNENEAFRAVEIETVDEKKEPAVAEKFDYWFVPTIYSDGVKVHEGALSKEKLKEILASALE